MTAASPSELRSGISARLKPGRPAVRIREWALAGMSPNHASADSETAPAPAG